MGRVVPVGRGLFGSDWGKVACGSEGVPSVFVVFLCVHELNQVEVKC
jgi:hypothetical protein